MNIIGHNLKALRIEKGISISELVVSCEKLDWSISAEILQSIELESRTVTDVEVLWLATALNVRVDKLFD